MEKLLKMVFTTENVRTAIILVAMTCGFVWLRSDMREQVRTEITAVREDLTEKIDELSEEMDGKMEEMSEKIEAVQEDVHTMKTNDIAHLHTAIEALTFTLMKNGTLTLADKEYIDTRLKSKP